MSKTRATTPATKGAPLGSLASGDPLARAIEGAKRLREAGFHPARISVTSAGAEIDLAVPVFTSSGGRGRDAGTAKPKSLADEYLPQEAAALLGGGGAPAAAPPSDDDGDDADFQTAVKS